MKALAYAPGRGVVPELVRGADATPIAISGTASDVALSVTA